MPVVPSEVFKQVRLIEIRTRRLVNDLFSGEYHSIFKGRGIEFDEVREYLPGDDVRQIDWNVTARYGTPFIKKFTEERELSVVFLVDASGSQSFGSGKRLKSELAAELTSLLALAAIKNNDKVAGIFFTDRIEKFVPPNKGRTHVLRLIRETLYFKPVGRGTDMAAAIRYLLRVIKRRSVVFVISDFLATNFDRELLLAGRKHDLIAIRLSDPREQELPACGLVYLEDAETGRAVWVDTQDASFRERFQRSFGQDEGALVRLFKQNRIDFVSLNSSKSYIEPLVRFFKMRERRFH